MVSSRFRPLEFPFRKACLKGGAGAVPAGGIANPHPGGSGAPLGRQKDRSAGSPLDWTSVRQAKHLLLPRPRKRGSGAESAGYGRFGECRGEAPEGERAPTWRASAPVHCSGGDVCHVWRGQWTACAFRRSASLFLRMILSENRTPLFGIMREPEANQKSRVVVVVCKPRAPSASRERIYFHLSPVGRGRLPSGARKLGEGGQIARALNPLTRLAAKAAP